MKKEDSFVLYVPSYPLTVRTHNGLRNYFADNFLEILAIIGAERLKTAKNLGRKSINEIATFLQDEGIISNGEKWRKMKTTKNVTLESGPTKITIQIQER